MKQLACDRGDDRVALGVQQQNCELIAADTPNQVAGTHRHSKPQPNLGQQRVADCMTARIIHQLESVEVEIQHCDVRRRPCRPAQLLFQTVPHGGAISELRQIVVLCHEGEALFGDFSLRHINDGSHGSTVC